MRYFGGKAKIANQIAIYINNLIGGAPCNISEENKESVNKSLNSLIPYTHTHTHTHYVEPFCGSCNVANKVNIENKILNDKNPYLIAMFKALQNGWTPPEIVTETDYYIAKQNQDIEPHVAGFVGFACSFAGKFWGGYARSNNDRNYALNGKNSILTKMKSLGNVEFICKDFLELDFKNKIIYCDPPYKNSTTYYEKILGIFPYEEFVEWSKEQSKNNIVLVSEYKHNMPKDANIVLEIPSKTSIRDKSGNVIETTEILYTYNNIKNLNN